MPDRLIRESICSSETLNQLNDFEERFWHRLIVNCDDYGRFDARPEILKARLFPLMEGKTKKDMTGALSKLASVGLVELYEVDGKPFLRVVTWDKYQRVRAKRSKFPDPPTTCGHMSADDSNSPRNPIQSYAYAYSEAESDARTREDVAAVMQAYMDRIDPTPSRDCLDQLLGYIDEMGADCCLRAISVAEDNNARKWSYIRSVLRDKCAQGVRNVAQWDALEAKRQQAASIMRGQKQAAAAAQAPSEWAREAVAQMMGTQEENTNG